MNEKSTLYYDGKCKLSNTWLGLIRHLDKNKRIEYVPLQSDKGKKLVSQLNTEGVNPDTVIFEKGGIISIRSEAVLNCLMQLGGWWATVKVLRILPLKFRDAIYNYIARNRYKFVGKPDSVTCKNEN